MPIVPSRFLPRVIVVACLDGNLLCCAGRQVACDSQPRGTARPKTKDDE